MFKTLCRAGCGVAALGFFVLGGCAINQSKSSENLKAPVVQRDVMADAARAVERAPWPAPEPVSLIERITGAGDDHTSQSDAIEIYLRNLRPDGARFGQLARDANANLAAAARFQAVAEYAVTSPRLSMNDIGVVERAIQTLRSHRRIYSAAAHDLEKGGELVDASALDAIRDDYNRTIKLLGKTADRLADRVEKDRSEIFAGATVSRQ